MSDQPPQTATPKPVSPQQFTKPVYPQPSFAAPDASELVPRISPQGRSREGGAPLPVPAVEIPAAQRINDYVFGVFSGDLDEPGQAAARKKAFEELFAFGYFKRVGKSIVGIGEGPPLLDNPASRKVNKSGEPDRPVRFAPLLPPSERPPLTAGAASAADPDFGSGFPAVPVPVAEVDPQDQTGAPSRITFGPVPGVISGVAVRELLPFTPIAIARGFVSAAASDFNLGNAVIKFTAGGSSGTVAVKLPSVPKRSFDPRNVRATTAIALASASEAEGIRRELITEVADP